MNKILNNLGAVPLDLDSEIYTPEFKKWLSEVAQPGFGYHIGFSANGKSTVIYRETEGKLNFWARVPNSLNVVDVECEPVPLP